MWREALRRERENPLYFSHRMCYNSCDMEKQATLSRFLLTKVRTQAL